MDKNYIKNSLMAAAALAINGAANPAAKATNALIYKVDGTVYTAAAAKTFTLTGTIPASQTNSYALFIDTAGTTTVTQGTVNTAGGGATQSYSSLSLPQEVPGKCLVGWLIIRNGTASTFTGGTTALDTASLTVSYIDNFGVVSL